MPEAALSDQVFSVDPFEINTYSTKFKTEYTVSMVYTPDEPGDSRTVVQYRKGDSGDWTTAKPGEPIELQNTENTECPVREQPWMFIITSTKDTSFNTLSGDGKSHGKLSFSVTPPPKPPCEEDLDKCLIGSWNLDLATMQEYMGRRMQELQGITVSNLALSGSSTLEIPDTYTATETFNAFKISYNGAMSTIPGPGWHTDIFIDGSIQGTIVKGTRPSSFTWAQGALSSGTVHTETQIEGIAATLPIDVPIDQQYGSQTEVEYVCKGDTLEMTGYIDNTVVWVYTWTRAS